MFKPVILTSLTTKDLTIKNVCVAAHVGTSSDPVYGAGAVILIDGYRLIVAVPNNGVYQTVKETLLEGGELPEFVLTPEERMQVDHLANVTPRHLRVNEEDLPASIRTLGGWIQRHFPLYLQSQSKVGH